MAMLNMAGEISVAKLKEDFNRETGLYLNIISDSGLDDNVTLYDIIKKKYFKMFRDKIILRPTPDRLNIGTYFKYNLDGFLHIDSADSIAVIVDTLESRYGIDTEIVYSDGSKVDRDLALCEARPESFVDPERDHDFLLALNQKLILIEKDIYDRWISCKKQIENSIAMGDDWLTDYEIDVKIQYFLKEDDPLDCEYSDNIVVEQSCCLGTEEWCCFINDDETDHRCRVKFPSHEGIRHCWLFHDLYDHRYIRLSDICRIGRIWVDINVYHQHDYVL